MWIFKKQPLPLPQPIYKRKPIATVAIILTIVATFVLGPIGVIYNSMSEELKNVRSKVEVVQKEKVDNTILKEALDDLKEERRDRNKKAEKRDDAIQQNQQAIQKILIRQELSVPKSLKIMGSKSVQKLALTPEQFEKYILMSPKIRAKYKKYLKETGKDTSGLPD
jgi:cell division protein FtsX